MEVTKVGRKKLACYKIKDGKQTKIPNKVCLSQKDIDKYLDKGYTVSKVTEIKTKHGSATEIKTFSPLTRAEAWELHKKKWGTGIPF